MNWASACEFLKGQNKSFVLVTILQMKGSSPRDPGTKMVVSEDDIFDTIGGGKLEHIAIQLSRQLIESGKSSIQSEQYNLSKDLGQCCGGQVTVLYECMAKSQFEIAVFGGGHVGRALAAILSTLPYKLSWIDSRAEVVSNINSTASQSSIRIRLMENPDFEVARCPTNSLYLVMTHSHDLDFQLVEAILSRPDVAFCGLIGSQSKAASFRSRLKRKAFSQEEITRLTCPIGMVGISGKSPAEIAVSVAAQILELVSGLHNLNQNTCV